MEVYDRPQSLFAATFLGEANLLRGIVRAGAVETASIVYTPLPLPVAGSSVELAIRP